MSYHKCHAALCVILPDSMHNSMRNSHTQAKAPYQRGCNGRHGSSVYVTYVGLTKRASNHGRTRLHRRLKNAEQTIKH